METWIRETSVREPSTDLTMPAQRRLAVRAAHRGPVPDDPAVLDAALDIAGYDLAPYRRTLGAFGTAPDGHDLAKELTGGGCP